jgi:hypothetical protein
LSLASEPFHRLYSSQAFKGAKTWIGQRLLLGLTSKVEDSLSWEIFRIIAVAVVVYFLLRRLIPIEEVLPLESEEE